MNQWQLGLVLTQEGAKDVEIVGYPLSALLVAFETFYS